MTDLLPCPHCGGAAKLLRNDEERAWMVVCA
jgi:ssDNA-binding Zn-finger/Zn-ribbon topoisomerase 1